MLSYCMSLCSVSCCNVHYDFSINTIFGSSLPPVVLGILVSFLRYLCLIGVQQILCCVFVLFVFVSCLVYPMLTVSLDCPLCL